MDIKLIGNSIVIINTGIIPSTFNSYWLVKNEILEEEELNNDNVFTKQIVEINGNDCKFIINANSFQISPKEGSAKLDDSVKGKIEKLIDSTTNTIYLSSGINFNWIIEPDEDFKVLSRKLFFQEKIPIFESFNKEDATFGSYLSMDFNGARLKLDIKPIYLGNNQGVKKGAIHFNFNFHFDIPEGNRKEILKEFINKREIYYEESKKLMNNML